MRIWRIFVAATVIVMISCSNKKNADLIIINAKVYIVDDVFSTAKSFAVVEGKIAATGTNEEILSKYTSKTVEDTNGKFIYPGFNDAHCHFNGYATNLIQYADLSDTKSQEEIYERLKQHHKKYGGDWILGRGWDQNDWYIKDFPDKTILDELFPDVPVYLIRVDGHAGWCNSKAIKLAGISADTKLPGGEVLTKNGEPTGILIDNTMGLVGKIIPEITSVQQKKGLLEAQKNCFAVGLTSVTDAGLDKANILLIEEIQRQDTLKMRINAMLSPSKENFETFLKNGPKQEDRLTINTVKMFADGALGSRGALLLQDYSDDPGNSGLQIESQEYYDSICGLAYENNFIVATHAIGDSANRLILNTYSKFLKGKNDRRWRIEHSQIILPDDVKKFAEFSIIPSVQATHCTSDMYWADERLGEERLKGAYAYQTLLQQNGWLPNGTDFPVEKINPLFTFYASVFRKDHSGWPESGWHTEEALTREQALRSITIWPAKASFEENKKGSLEPGKYADFVILDTDLMIASPQEVLNAKIVSTWVNGERVYKN